MKALPFRLNTVFTAIFIASIFHAEAQQSADSNEIETITIFGEKKEQTIFETGSSVHAFDANALNSLTNVSEIDDLLEIIPNLVSSGMDNNLPTVRGIDGSGPSVGGLASFAGTAPRLNMSIDGRSLTYSEIAFGPRSLWDMQQIEVYLGPQSYIQGRSASAGSIVMKSNDPVYYFDSAIKVGIANHDYRQTAVMVNAPLVDDELALRFSADRQTKNSHLDIVSYQPAGDSREISTTNIRTKLRYEPSALEELTSTLTFNYMDTRAPQSENEVGSFFPKERPVYDTDSTSADWQIVYQISDAVIFENSVNYTDFGYERITDPKGRRADFITDGEEIFIEPIIRYNPSNASLPAITGLRYFDSAHDDVYTHNRGKNDMTGETTTRSAFAEVVYKVNAQFTATLGGRYESETVTRVVPLFALDYDETTDVFLPKIDINFAPKENQAFGFKSGKGFNSGGAGLSFNTFTARAPMKPYSFDTEYVWNYELYSRQRFFQNTLELTSNLFYNDYDGMQILQTHSDGYVSVQNLDSANTYGAEVNLRWLALDNLELSGGVGLLESEYKKNNTNTKVEKELPRAPSASANLNLVYRFLNSFQFSANANYSSSYYSDRNNIEALKVDAYWRANVKLAYKFNNGRIALYVDNLFDADDITLISSEFAPESPLTITPRTIGANFEYHF